MTSELERRVVEAARAWSQGRCGTVEIASAVRDLDVARAGGGEKCEHDWSDFEWKNGASARACRKCRELRIDALPAGGGEKEEGVESCSICGWFLRPPFTHRCPSTLGGAISSKPADPITEARVHEIASGCYRRDVSDAVSAIEILEARVERLENAAIEASASSVRVGEGESARGQMQGASLLFTVDPRDGQPWDSDRLDSFTATHCDWSIARKKIEAAARKGALHECHEIVRPKDEKQHPEVIRERNLLAAAIDALKGSA